MTDEIKKYIRHLESQVVRMKWNLDRLPLVQLDNAAVLEDMSEHLGHLHLRWMLKHGEDAPEKLPLIEEFLSFCADEIKEDINSKRGPQETSYEERRDTAVAYREQLEDIAEAAAAYKRRFLLGCRVVDQREALFTALDKLAGKP